MEKSCEKAGESGRSGDGGGEDADDNEESVSEILSIAVFMLVCTLTSFKWNQTFGIIGASKFSSDRNSFTDVMCRNYYTHRKWKVPPRAGLARMAGYHVMEPQIEMCLHLTKRSHPRSWVITALLIYDVQSNGLSIPFFTTAPPLGKRIHTCAHSRNPELKFYANTLHIVPHLSRLHSRFNTRLLVMLRQICQLILASIKRLKIPGFRLSGNMGRSAVWFHSYLR